MFLKNAKILTGEPAHPHPGKSDIHKAEYATQILFFAIAVIFCFYIPGFLNNLFLTVSGLSEGFISPVLNF
jgi:hypothetical protein